MLKRLWSRGAAVLFGILCICLDSAGQATGGGTSPSAGGGSTSPGATPSAVASASTVPIESETIAYEAVRQIAKGIGILVGGAALKEPRLAPCVKKYTDLHKSLWESSHPVPSGFASKSEKDEWKKAETERDRKLPHEAQTSCGTPQAVLLGSASNLSAIGAYRDYEAVANQLIWQYDVTVPDKVSGLSQQNFLGGGAAAVSTIASTIASTINTIKTQTTQTGSTFTPVEQVLYSDLENVMASKITFVIAPYPTDYISGNNAAAKLYSRVVAKRDEAIQKWRNNFPVKNPNATEEQKKNYNPVSAELSGLESAFTAFQGLLSGSNGPTIQYGAALLSAIGDQPFDVLTMATAAVGGGDRANTYFLLNIFIPAPHHSYNGGAEVAFTLRNEDGFYKTGDTLRMVYGYTKWRPPSLHSENKNDFTNINGWSNKDNNKGHPHWWRY